LAISPQGVLVVADTQNHLIRALTPTGQVATLAGSGQAGLQDGSGSRASFSLPLGVAVDAQSTVYVADSGNHTIRQVQLVGTVGTVLTIAGNGTAGYREGLGAAVSLNQPTAVVVDAAGNLVIAEGGGQRVRTLYRSPN
jgi:sugar lactone lactonase YvrE